MLLTVYHQVELPVLLAAHQSVAVFAVYEGAVILHVCVQVSPGHQLAALLTGMRVELTFSFIVGLSRVQSEGYGIYTTGHYSNVALLTASNARVSI